MKTPASLVIKHYGENVSANTCIGGQSIVSSGWTDSLNEAVSKAFDNRFKYVSVLTAVDFTRMLSLEQYFPGVLYIQVHPTAFGQSKPVHESPLTGYVLNFSLKYDPKNGFVNTAELFALLDVSRPVYIAVNTPYIISKFNIEAHICKEIADRYPKMIIYPSRHLTNRDFFTRGNMLLLNLLLRPKVENYLTGLKQILQSHRIACPVFFLRNTGMIGEYTVKHTSMHTCRSEELCLLFDVLSQLACDEMYIADWSSESLYFVHQGNPQMIRMPVEFGSTRIHGQIPVRYSLQKVSTCAQLLELLNAHNPFPGSVPFVSVGSSPFPLSRMFEYPVVNVHPDSLASMCGLRRAAYALELEAFDQGRSSAETENEETETLRSLALQDSVPPGAINILYERLPLKYLNDDQLIIRIMLKADLGVLYETN